MVELWDDLLRFGLGGLRAHSVWCQIPNKTKVETIASRYHLPICSNRRSFSLAWITCRFSSLSFFWAVLSATGWFISLGTLGLSAPTLGDRPAVKSSFLSKLISLPLERFFCAGWDEFCEKLKLVVVGANRVILVDALAAINNTDK